MATTNSIDLITKYQEGLDTVYKQESRASLLDAQKLVFTGAKTVKIYKFQSGGMSDYYRNSENNYAMSTDDAAVLANNPQAAPAGATFVGNSFGYQPTTAGMIAEEFTLKCDRAARYQIEAMDNEETNGQMISIGVGEIERTTIIPEVDAYTFSTLASLAGTVVEDNILAADYKPLSAINTAFLYMDEHEVPADKQILFVSAKFFNALRSTPELVRYLSQADYNSKVKFVMVNYEGRPIVMVTPDRFKTNIIMGRNGYRWSTNSKDINFILCAKDAVYHVTKFSQLKVIGGEANLAGANFDGYSIFARVYHDVFVPDNKRVAVYANIASAAQTPTVTRELNVKMTVGANDGTVDAISWNPANLMLFTKYIAAAAAPAVGTTAAAGAKLFKVGDKIAKDAANSTYAIAVDSYDRIVIVTKILDKKS